jgi:hypothetical protein
MGRHKLSEDDVLLAVAREAFVERRIVASSRDIARRAGISEAVVYQRHPTKAHLFFAAMVPPASAVVPIPMQLVTHPAFDGETFAQRHPDSPFGRMHLGDHPVSRVPTSTWGPRP